MSKPLCILTGASSGIGSAIYKKMLQQGYPVLSISRRDPAFHTLPPLPSESPKPPSTFHIPFDLRDIGKFHELESKIRQAEETLNTFSSILVNCAGISKDKLLLSADHKDIESTINVNLIAPMLLSRIVLKRMIRKNSGQIINIASIIGTCHGNPGQSIYAASKSGLIGFSKSLAKEVGGRNIKVNCIAPGLISSEMTDGLSLETKKKYIDAIPLKKFGHVDGIADLVMFLITTPHHYMTGSCIVVDGGLSA